MDNAKWPAPLLKFYLDQTNGRQLAAATVNPDQTTEWNQFCEMDFYVGEMLASQSLQSRAKVRFQAAMGFCPRSFTEYEGSMVELKRRAITKSKAK